MQKPPRTRNCGYDLPAIGKRFDMAHVPVVVPSTFHYGVHLRVTESSALEALSLVTGALYSVRNQISRVSYFSRS